MGSCLQHCKGEWNNGGRGIYQNRWHGMRDAAQGMQPGDAAQVGGCLSEQQRQLAAAVAGQATDF